MTSEPTTRTKPKTGVIDRDEHGRPVDERYRRLGAGSERGDDEGLYVRFEPGFGLNVHIGFRQRRLVNQNDKPMTDDSYELVMGIQGWERICEFVDEYRAREALYAQRV